MERAIVVMASVGNVFLLLMLIATFVEDGLALDHRSNLGLSEADSIGADIPWRQESEKVHHRIRVMTFNLWYNGRQVDDGLAKIAKHISVVNPDIVAIQEVLTEDSIKSLVRLLGPNWNYRLRHTAPASAQRPDTGILARHPIFGSAPADECSIRAKVRVEFFDGSHVNVSIWSLHLSMQQYGPYAACRNGTTADKLTAGEQFRKGNITGRLQDIVNVVGLLDFKKDLLSTGDDPMLVAGDFNSPSHLDWIDSTRRTHCQRTFEWPVTKFLSIYGLIDSFRAVHPDPLLVPGNTWSPVEKAHRSRGRAGDFDGDEPQDRIDFVFYKSQRWSPVNAEVYFGDKTIATTPEHRQNDWPSDHASVVVEFKKTVFT